MSTTLAPTQALETKAGDLSAQLAALALADPREAAPAVLNRTLEQSVLIRNLADDYLREVEASFGPIVKKAHEAHRAAVAERDRLKAPAEHVKRGAGDLGYTCDRELKRRQAEAERLQREEQARLEREAQARAAAEEAAQRRAAEDARLAEAEEAAARGDTASAERLLDAPLEVSPVQPAPVFVPPPPEIARRVEGASFGEQWGDFTIEDEGKIPREYMMPDSVKIRRVVAALKVARPIPGILATPKPRAARR